MQIAKLGIVAATVAAFVIGCGDDKPAKDPSTENKPAEPAMPSTPPPADTTASTMPAADTKPADPPAPPAPKKLSDAEIVATVETVNDGEVQMADLAKKNAASADVKTFAAMMQTHHSKALSAEKTLSTKAKIAPSDNDLSTSIKSDAQSTLSDLKTKKGADFDKAYIDAQVKAHQDVLKTIDDRLLTSVDNADLKTHLNEVRGTVASHLQKAQDIQTKLAAGPSTTSTTTSTMKTTTPKPKTDKK